MCANTKGIGQMHFPTERCIMIACVNHNGLPARGNVVVRYIAVPKFPLVFSLQLRFIRDLTLFNAT